MRYLFPSLLLSLLLPVSAWAACPSRTYTYTTGQVVDPSQVTTNEDSLFTYSCAVDTFADGSIATADLADNAVTAAKILDGTIGVADIATDGVGAAEIAADAVGTSEIATDGVGAAEIAADAVSTSEIATDGVGAAEIAANAVGASEMADSAVDLATATVTGTLPVANGGTGATTLTDGGLLLGSGTGAITPLGVATNGQIPIGDGTTDPVLATLTGTADEITVTNGGGTITLDIPDPLIAGKGGTGAASLTDGGILLGSGTGAITALGVATNGQIPIGDGTTDPVLATLTQGTNVTITNGAGTITIAATGGTARAIMVFGSTTSQTATFSIGPGGLDSNATESPNVDRVFISTTTNTSNLRCACATAPGAGNSWLVQVSDGGTVENPSCTISDTNNSCSDTVNTGSIGVASTIAVKWTETGTATGTGNAACALEYSL